MQILVAIDGRMNAAILGIQSNIANTHRTINLRLNNKQNHLLFRTYAPIRVSMSEITTMSKALSPKLKASLNVDKS